MLLFILPTSHSPTSHSPTPPLPHFPTSQPLTNYRPPKRKSLEDHVIFTDSIC
ncbi:MAG: hypothetical protein O9295_14230 [Microcystis sp. LE18-22.4A]|uniref:hypothetical protein n=1 Tax=Microcystis sp. LE19-195.1E TaxID=3016440 RepID=UPI0022C7910D|nr:hypothetical protein [Microcystis sp. LE19-195.1E]MCZ8119176.1 hypothetical protein [Microcystis sp. LE18-22.4A]